MDTLKLIECPRDAMQGLQDFVPTKLKAEYINALLKVGFDTIDFGSFVSPKAIPQLRDTADVLHHLDLSATKSKLLAIVANFRGANDAAQFEQIQYLGYPFSISEQFQLRNTRKTISESLALVEEMQNLAVGKGKELVVYISMGFGNPYGEEWSPEIAEKWVAKMVEMNIRTISLADTIGIANPEIISQLFGTLIPRFPQVEFGAHFHSTVETRHEKLEAAWKEGCRRFDSALNGFGGCPFAEDELVGNVATESVLGFLDEKGISAGIDKEALKAAMYIAPNVFG